MSGVISGLSSSDIIVRAAMHIAIQIAVKIVGYKVKESFIKIVV